MLGVWVVLRCHDSARLLGTSTDVVDGHFEVVVVVDASLGAWRGMYLPLDRRLRISGGDVAVQSLSAPGKVDALRFASSRPACPASKVCRDLLAQIDSSERGRRQEGGEDV